MATKKSYKAILQNIKSFSGETLDDIHSPTFKRIRTVREWIYSKKVFGSSGGSFEVNIIRVK